MASQYLNALRVKGADHGFGKNLFTFFGLRSRVLFLWHPKKFGDTLFHFASGFIRKRDGKNSVWFDTVANQIADSKGDHACLARSRARQNQHRARERLDGCRLSRIEPRSFGSCFFRSRFFRSLSVGARSAGT